MIIDLNSVENSTAKKQFDVCICGAGPAGITVARTLAAQGKKVALFEGGGLQYTEGSQNLYKGESVGLKYWDSIHTARLRYFGGTSNHWGGRCAVYGKAAYEQRKYFGMPGWPIARDEVLRHLDAACSILDVPKEAFQASTSTKWGGSNFKFSEYALSPPTRFGTKYYDELKNSSKIDVYINASVTDINLNAAFDAVTSFEVRNFNNQKFLFSADNFVVALGALENARLLLNCDNQIPNGIGNQNGMVGRCFMEHFNVEIGKFVAEDTPVWKTGQVQLNPTDEMIKRLNIGNGVLAFDRSVTPVSYGRLKQLKQALRNEVCKSETLTDISRKAFDFNCAGDGVITSMIEQAPNLKSRVFLGKKEDMFGMRQIILDWQVNDADRNTIRTLGLEVAKDMARYGSARVQLKNFILDKTIEISDFGQHAHQMGTTRMSADPKYGVVDTNSRIFGFKNIYIAGSSVFPTGGGANPTITLVMLSARLGNHLSKS